MTCTARAPRTRPPPRTCCGTNTAAAAAPAAALQQPQLPTSLTGSTRPPGPKADRFSSLLIALHVLLLSYFSDAMEAEIKKKRMARTCTRLDSCSKSKSVYNQKLKFTPGICSPARLRNDIPNS